MREEKLNDGDATHKKQRAKKGEDRMAMRQYEVWLPSFTDGQQYRNDGGPWEIWAIPVECRPARRT